MPQAEPRADLSSLNTHERAVLGLLAEGHTVKSIAALTRRSEASVNERLREARRKTGVGSSRELARLLKAQENRDEQIGVATPTTAAALAGPDAARPAGGTRKGPILMLALILGGAAAVTFVLPAALHRPAQDATLEAFFPDGHNDSAGNARRLAGLLRSEPRDTAWAPAAETALRNRHRGIAGVDPSMTVTCAATVCEVMGALLPGLPDAQQNAAVKALQDLPGDEAGKLGLHGADLFGVRTGPGEPVRFAILWVRKR